MKPRLLILLLLLSIGCEDPTSEDIFRTPDFRDPVITGLVFVGESPDFIFGILGNPNHNPAMNGNSINAFPTPFFEITKIRLRSPHPTTVKIFIMPAVLGESASSLLQNYSGATTLTAEGRPLLSTEIALNSMNNFDWRPAESNAPEGFYRIYALFADGTLLWEDVWYTNRSETDRLQIFQ